MRSAHAVWQHWDDALVRMLGDGGALVFDSVLGRDVAASVFSRVQALAHDGELKPAGVGRLGGHRLDQSIRQDLVAWLTPESATEFQEIQLLFESVRIAVNEHCWLGLKRFDTQIALYPGDGARYDRHRDAFHGQTNRRLTAIYYPNVDWRPDHGGQLRLHFGDISEDIEPLADRLVIFLSEYLDHQVLPVFHPRAAITAWFYGSSSVFDGRTSW